jgi:hypothetical protein
MLSKLKTWMAWNIFARNVPIEFEAGEFVLFEAKGAMFKGQFGIADWAPLFITNRRLLWRHSGWLRLNRDIDLPLGEIVDIEKRGRFGRLQSGPGFRLRLRDRRAGLVYWDGPEPDLDVWIVNLRSAISQYGVTSVDPSSERATSAGEFQPLVFLLWVAAYPAGWGLFEIIDMIFGTNL